MTNLSEELRVALQEALERALTAMSDRVYSPRIKLLNIHQVSEATGFGESTIDAMVKTGRFPKPLKDLGKKVWPESRLIAWVRSRDPSTEDEREGG